jgi:hypothetical protein
MTHFSPTMEGFRTAFRQPEIALAEVVWRWAFGGAAAFLLAFSFFEYLDTVPVTLGDVLFLRSGQPFLISQAIAHLFAGSALRFVMSMLIVLPALALVWIAAASAGRLATTRRLLEHFQLDGMVSLGPRQLRPKLRVQSLFGLNLLRVALALAALIGVLAALILAGFVTSDADPQPGLAFVIFLAITVLVGLFWLALNWFLSLASLFVLSEGRDTFSAISAAVDFCRRRAGAVAWSSVVFAVIHFLAFVLATSAAFVPLLLIGSVPREIVFLGVLLVTLAYFAVVDFLYVGRLASYVAILIQPDAKPAPSIIELPPTGMAPAAARSLESSAVDPQELILSDSPSPIACASPSDEDILSDIPGFTPPPENPVE